MNTLESCFTTDPNGKTSECAKFTIDELDNPFILYGITTVDQEYTLGFWIRADSDVEFSVCSQTVPVTSDWSRHVFTYVADATDLVFNFVNPGTYYIFHPKLEAGNKATDWSPAPEDATDEMVDYVSGNYFSKEEGDNRLSEVEAKIQLLVDSISMLVTDGNGMSLMEQTADGWTFSVGSMQDALDKTSQGLNELTNELGDTNATVDALGKALDDFGVITEYVKIGVYEDEPCIELGEGDSDFKLLITNTRIMFMEGSSVPTYITNKTLHTDKIRVESEIQQGDFIWSQRENGNLGLTWKGATS